MKADLATIGPEASLKARRCVGPTRARNVTATILLRQDYHLPVDGHTTASEDDTFRFPRHPHRNRARLVFARHERLELI